MIQVFKADDVCVLSGEFDIWGYNRKERKAQERRIKAAAPALYAALKATVVMYGPSDEYDHEARQVWEQAEAALAQAEGRQP